MLLLLEIELLGTAVACAVFLVLFFIHSDGLTSIVPAIRATAWHIVAVTVVAMGEAAILAMLGLGVPIPRWAVVAGYGAGFLVVLHRIVLLARAAFPPRDRIVMLKTLLRKDGRNRAWRTFLQALAATVLIPAGDAALQVLERDLLATAAGKPFDWREVAASAGLAFATGAVMAGLAYLHRVKLDPSPIPSAVPPPPVTVGTPAV